MPTPRNFFAAHRRLLQGTGFSAVTALLAAAAFLYPGVTSADVDLNDGGVWVTNKSVGMTARLNYPSKTLDGGVTPAAAGFEILQHEGEILVDAGSSLTAVDPAAMRLGEPVMLPGGVTAAAGQGAYVFSDPGTGEAWLASTDTVRGFDRQTSEPVVSGAPNLQAVIGADGAAYITNPAAHEVTRLTVDDDGTAGDKATASYADFSAAESLQLTTVGADAVLLDTDSGRLYLPGGRTVDLPDAEGSRLQQPGPVGSFVAVATPDGLIEQPLDGSAAATKPSGGNGNPVRPVQLDGCVHAAWNKSNLYLRDCADDTYDKLTDVPNANNKSDLVFRVNRSVVVLNDTNGGNVWLVQQAMQLVNNWQDLQTPPTRTRSISSRTAPRPTGRPTPRTTSSASGRARPRC